MAKLTPAQVEALRSVPLGAMPNRLALALSMAQLRQVRVARETGINAPTVSDLARGSYKDLMLETARTLAEYFGCSIEDLFPARPARAKEAMSA